MPIAPPVVAVSDPSGRLFRIPFPELDGLRVGVAGGIERTPVEPVDGPILRR